MIINITKEIDWINKYVRYVVTADFSCTVHGLSLDKEVLTRLLINVEVVTQFMAIMYFVRMKS